MSQYRQMLYELCHNLNGPLITRLLSECVEAFGERVLMFKYVTRRNASLEGMLNVEGRHGSRFEVLRLSETNGKLMVIICGICMDPADPRFSIDFVISETIRMLATKLELEEATRPTTVSPTPYKPKRLFGEQ